MDTFCHKNGKLEEGCKIMIYFYSGTPGSGKSLHAAKDIYDKLLRKKQGVIANFPINEKILKRKRRGKFTYVSNFEATPEFFIEYATKNHKQGKEGQTLVVIDECQILFNPRTWNNKDRLKWIEFFTQHRKWGYNFIMISQFDKLVDKQIRSLFEYEVKHRKANNFSILAMVPVKVFVAVTVWYGVKEKIGSEFFIFKKKYSNLYNSYKNFKEKEVEENE